MRLIDAHALWVTLLDSCKSLEDALRIIDKAPTIEAAPVKHGEWIDKTTWFGGIGKCKYECSNCEYTIDYDPKSRGDRRGGNYCDDCGAKMDEKHEGKSADACFIDEAENPRYV